MKLNLKKSLSVLSGCVVLSLGVAASAQDISAQPTYGTQSLTSGFTPDPATVAVQAGGDDAVKLEGCTGFINNAAPDVDLNFTAGELPLNIYVKSAEDTTLVVNLPNGDWICNDDSNGLNPLLSFAKPQSGNYNIWVGNYNDTSTPDATVHISEMDPQW